MKKYLFRHIKSKCDDISGRMIHERGICICQPSKTQVNIKKIKREMWLLFVKLDLQIFWISKYNC